MLTAQQYIERQRGIGGSDAAVVVGLSPFKSAYQLYLEKRGEGASIAVLPGLGQITWKQAAPSTKISVDIEKLKVDYPDIHAACCVTEVRAGSRRFLLKPDKE